MCPDSRNKARDVISGVPAAAPLALAARGQDPPGIVHGLLLLAAAICACNAPPEAPSARPDPGTLSDPSALWIAMTNRGNRYRGDEDETLMPIARQLDGTWDNAPWAGLLYIDGRGPGIEAVKTGDGVWSWPDAREYWEHPGRAVDTLGRTPDVIATGVPLSWHLYSLNEQGVPLSTTGLALTQAHCDHRWAISIARSTVPAAATDAFGPPGVALTRRPAEVLAEDDIPGLEQIRRTLGFADISEGQKGDRSFYWLGIFRFDDGTPTGPADAPTEDARADDTPPAGASASTTLGVLWGRYYESAEYILIEIDGDRSRVIIRTSEGGC